MKTSGPGKRLDTAEIRLMEEAADSVNLLAIDLAIRALDRNTDGDFSTVDGVSILNMAEWGMNLTGRLNRVMSMRTVVTDPDIVV